MQGHTSLFDQERAKILCIFQNVLMLKGLIHIVLGGDNTELK